MFLIGYSLFGRSYSLNSKFALLFNNNYLNHKKIPVPQAGTVERAEESGIDYSDHGRERRLKETADPCIRRDSPFSAYQNA